MVSRNIRTDSGPSAFCTYQVTGDFGENGVYIEMEGDAKLQLEGETLQ